MGTLIATNRSGRLSVLHTDGFGPCMCMIAENENAGAAFLAHVSKHWDGALEGMIEHSRRTPKDKINLHMMGGLHDYTIKQFEPEFVDTQWKADIERMIAALNSHPNVELKTFDVGVKPHPHSVAATWNSDGKFILVRGSADITTSEEMHRSSNSDGPGSLKHGLFSNVQRTPLNLEASAEYPFVLAYDGRLDQKPRAFEVGQSGKPCSSSSRWLELNRGI